MIRYTPCLYNIVPFIYVNLARIKTLNVKNMKRHQENKRVLLHLKYQKAQAYNDINEFYKTMSPKTLYRFPIELNKQIS